MADATQNKVWTSVGNSHTTPTDNKKRNEVQHEDAYYLVVGFEVNNKEAFINETHYVFIDPGHAFFYLVRNNIVQLLFSFGPYGIGKTGWFNQGEHDRENHPPNAWDTGALVKNGALTSRHAIPDYPINEDVSAFKITLTKKQADTLTKKTNEVRKEINSGKQKYTAWVNDTCAETARDILNDAHIDTPSGTGKVKRNKDSTFYLSVVNPFKWHDNFRKSGFLERKYHIGDGPWIPKIGAADPIFNSETPDK